jgi:hypothetical protein
LAPTSRNVPTTSQDRIRDSEEVGLKVLVDDDQP